MKYKNMIFDFGNVIGKFNGMYILKQFCESEEDCQLLASVVYGRWDGLDKGTIDYNEYIEQTIDKIPDRLEDTVRTFFRDWPHHLLPIEDTLRFIDELKSRNIPVYLLSNAPTHFADWAASYEPLRKFDGIVFSAPLKMAKPDPEIYEYLFETYKLKPEECFFIDDLSANIETAKKLGMDGIVFTGNIDEVKAAVGF